MYILSAVFNGTQYLGRRYVWVRREFELSGMFCASATLSSAYPPSDQAESQGGGDQPGSSQEWRGRSPGLGGTCTETEPGSTPGTRYTPTQGRVY